MRNNKNNISVCMAVYNGEKYLTEQIDSILSQLLQEDELIIVDDCSTDKSISIIKSYNDDRIFLYENSCNLGYVKSFEKAISLANKEYIFLSDQDDIWCKNRVDNMLEWLPRYKVVVGGTVNFKNNLVVDNTPEYVESNYCRRGYICELIKTVIGIGCYNKPGCATAFNRSLMDILLPFPFNVSYKNFCAHDLWLSICASVLNEDYYFKIPVQYHRLHDNNTSSSKTRNLFILILDRLNRVLCMFILFFRLFKLQNRVKK